VARNWGYRAGPLDAIKRVLEQPDAPSARRRTLSIYENAQTVRIGFTVGTGLVARFFDRYNRKGAPGLRTAAGIAARVFVGSLFSDRYSASILEPMPCRLVIAGSERRETAYSLIVCSVVRDLGLHLLVTYRAERSDSRLHLVASPLRPRALGPQVWRVLLGQPLHGPGSVDELVESFSIEFATDDGRYVLDGDSFRAQRIDVCAGPVLDVLRPS
jgi:hypothetical protein